MLYYIFMRLFLVIKTHNSIYCFLVPGVELTILCFSGMRCAAELHPWPRNSISSFKMILHKDSFLLPFVCLCATLLYRFSNVSADLYSFRNVALHHSSEALLVGLSSNMIVRRL